MSNYNSFAAWRFEQMIAYAILFLGAGIAYVIFTLNPIWGWFFVSASATVSAIFGFIMLLAGITEPINKKYLLIGVIVYFLPSLALGAYCALTNLN